MSLQLALVLQGLLRFLAFIAVFLLATATLALVGVFRFGSLFSCFHTFDLFQKLDYSINLVQFMASVKTIIFGP